MELIETPADSCGIYCDPQAIFIEGVAWALILIAGSIFIAEAMGALHRRLGGQ